MLLNLAEKRNFWNSQKQTVLESIQMHYNKNHGHITGVQPMINLFFVQSENTLTCVIFLFSVL